MSIISCKSEIENDSSISHSDSVATEIVEDNKFQILGERIDGPANVRDQPNGKAIFSLEDNVRICSFHGTDWLDLELEVEIDEDLSKDCTLRKGEQLRDDHGNLICTMLEDVKLEGVYYNKFYDKTYGYLWGYTYKDNIKPTSIIERNLEDYFNKFSDYTYDTMLPFMENFGFNEKVQYPLDVEWKNPTTEYLYTTGCFNYDESRLRLIFDSNGLVAIIHDREINIDGFESIDTKVDYDVIPIAEMTLDEQQLIVTSVEKAYYGTE